MKTPRLPSISSLMLLAAALGYGADTTPVKPLPFHASEITLAAHVGVTGSRLVADGDMARYLDPLDKAKPLTHPTYGVTLESRWHWVSLSLGGFYERVGQNTSKSTVEFPNNPFPHSLTASPWIDYLVLPLQGGFGAVGRRQSLFVHAGLYVALSYGSKIAWQVDGSDYSGAPVPTVQDGDNGWTLGLEYAIRMRRGSLLLDLGTRRSFSSIVQYPGMSGSARVATVSASLGYGFGW